MFHFCYGQINYPEPHTEWFTPTYIQGIFRIKVDLQLIQKETSQQAEVVKVMERFPPLSMKTIVRLVIKNVFLHLQIYTSLLVMIACYLILERCLLTSEVCLFV